MATLLIVNDFTTRGKCDLVVSKPLGYSESYAFGMSKQLPIHVQAIINREYILQAYTFIKLTLCYPGIFFCSSLYYLWQTGLLDYWNEKLYSTRRAAKCFDKSPATGPVQLTLTHVWGIFLLLGVGLVISIVSFFLEVIGYLVEHKGRRYSSRRSTIIYV